MYILKIEMDDFYRIVYWTLDGEHIFRVQRTPLIPSKKRGKDNFDSQGCQTI
jgi:hypothetical protein